MLFNNQKIYEHICINSNHDLFSHFYNILFYNDINRIDLAELHVDIEIATFLKLGLDFMFLSTIATFIKAL